MITGKPAIRYVGKFPPKYGGVTIKNELLCRYLDKEFDVKKITSKGKISQFLAFVQATVSRIPLIIGVSSMRKKSLLLTKFLYFFNKKIMRKSLYFMMGGLEASRISKNAKEIKLYSYYKKIYVELPAMKKQLDDAGLLNVEIYPNCRETKSFKKEPHKGFKCVFFSLISKMKGSDTVLDVAKKNPEIEFNFYGHIEEEYKEEFQKEISLIPNAHYCGVFQSSTENVYQKLSEYDVLLFPTKWKNEGIPGVLIEAKIAGIPVIATDIAFNKEIVEDGIDGIVLRENSSMELSESILRLKNDKSFCFSLSNGALINSKKYLINEYISKIVIDLKND